MESTMCMHILVWPNNGLIPGCWEPVTSHWKRDFAEVIKVLDLEMRAISPDCLDGPRVIT